jgi:hypothetical protein
VNSGIKIIESPISADELREIAGQAFGDMVKIVADIEKEIMAAGGELHADEEAVLLDHGSVQNNLWGANIYVDEPRESWLVFDSMINIRPREGNLSRRIHSEDIQNRIKAIVNKLIL